MPGSERWVHITEEYCELAGHLFDVLETIEEPQAVFEGTAGGLLAVKQIDAQKYLVVVYRELNDQDGFVITAFMTRKTGQLERRKKVWPR